jgi:DNA-binding MarR family transcriptional regulator
MTSQVVRALERRDLLVRTAHHTDGRAWSLSVTDQGTALANRAIVAVESCDQAFFRPLGRAQGTFTRALATLGRPPG